MSAMTCCSGRGAIVLLLTTTVALADDTRAAFPLIDGAAQPTSENSGEPGVWLDPHALAAAIAALPMPAERGLPDLAQKRSALPATKWDRTENKDGSAKVTVNRGVDVGWDAKVGVDFGVADVRDPAVRPDLAMAPQESSSGAAWAQVAVPALAAPLGWDKASINARVDPTKDQGKLSTTLSRSLPVGDSFAVTLQGSYSVTQTLANTLAPPPPAAGSLPGVGPSHVWEAERAVKFKLLPTDTTFSAGTTLSSADNQWHHQLGAEQKIYGPLNVTTSVTDPGTAASSKKITAGFKTTW